MDQKVFMVISSDVMGKEEDIGKVVMKNFFETVKSTKEIPHTIFFVNAGVKLTTLDDEVSGILKDIVTLGTEIYSCGTCLKHYDLEDKLRVGNRGASTQVVEALNEFKVVWV